jgi:hypothetical protein
MKFTVSAGAILNERQSMTARFEVCVIVVVPAVEEIVAAPPRTTPSTGPACAQAANNKPGNVNFNEPMDRSRKCTAEPPGR